LARKAATTGDAGSKTEATQGSQTRHAWQEALWPEAAAPLAATD